MTRDGSRIRLGGKAFQIFRLLLETPDQILTREAICEQLWPDSSVDVDANLATAVNKLRRILGDSCYDPLYIRTIPRTGYLLLGQPEFSDAPAQPAASGQNDKAAAKLPAPVRERREQTSGPALSFFHAASLFLVGAFLGAGMMTFWLHVVARAQAGVR